MGNKVDISRYWNGLNKPLLAAAIIAVILVFVFDFYLFDIEEAFKGASKIGRIFYNLLFSFITAYIFYLLTVYSKEYYNKQATAPSLKFYLRQIVSDAERVMKTISKTTAVHIDENSSLEDITRACNLINPLTIPPKLDELNKLVIPGNWYNHFFFHKEVVDTALTRVRSQYFIILDDELIDMLGNIENSSLFENINFCIQHNLGGTDLDFISKDLVIYFAAIKKLKKYIEAL
ncbi:hypothetical protein [Parabacteroides sp. PF5-6]|uniref:hypothetical protein n=1 Tax=Parabacteroides sp. PF5-6 TaxID=1742403 RepID=UPI002406569B|nr:hypothetical protein [Parabacteroides sp. PF5-6]MDF9829329.1 hypothetical protein [Parabacteroides sp. PF5-6]